MPIGDYCQRDVVSATPRTSLREAASQMAEAGVGALPVVWERKVTGIVTDRDVALAVLAEQKDADATEVGELLVHKPLIVVHEDSPFSVVSAIMRRHALRRLPVVDADEELVGMITSDDVLRLVSSEVCGLARAASAQAPPPTPSARLRTAELAREEEMS